MKSRLYRLAAIAALIAVVMLSGYKQIRIQDDLTYMRLSIGPVRMVYQQYQDETPRYAITADFGGIDTQDGIFFCPADWNQFPLEVGSTYRNLIPLWEMIPIADC